jgi:hypothetical protein
MLLVASQGHEQKETGMEQRLLVLAGQARGRASIGRKFAASVLVTLGTLVVSGVAQAHETTPKITCQQVTLPFVKFKEASLPVHIQVVVDGSTVLDTTPTLSFVGGVNTFVHPLGLSGHHTVRTFGSWQSSEGPGGWDLTATLDCPTGPTTTSTPPPSNGPDHLGYCDQNNVFQLLTVGQPVPPGWRPADVDTQTGAIFCAPPAVTPPVVIASTPTAPVTTAPPTTAAPVTAGAKKTAGVAGAKKTIVKKPVKRNAILKAKVKGAALPFTK